MRVSSAIVLYGRSAVSMCAVLHFNVMCLYIQCPYALLQGAGSAACATCGSVPQPLLTHAAYVMCAERCVQQSCVLNVVCYNHVS